MRNNRINYRKRVKLGIIGSLVICQIVFFVIRKFELSPAIKQDNRPKPASIIRLIDLKPPPKPKLPDPPAKPPEPLAPREILLPKLGSIKPVLDPVQEELKPVSQPSPAPVPHVPFIAYDQQPELIGGLTLNYPDWARKREIEGKVLVHILINMDGKVTVANVFKSSGYDILDEAAIQAATKSRWQPAKQRGEPVSVWVMVPVKFSLHR